MTFPDCNLIAIGLSPLSNRTHNRELQTTSRTGTSNQNLNRVRAIKYLSTASCQRSTR
ncbi:hypothetical protein Y027_4189 [Burkholderia pseudomallei TSV5]|nr:hypothetical protein Y027_4189 [Burkholderia pseudomallei TSV5]